MGARRRAAHRPPCSAARSARRRRSRWASSRRRSCSRIGGRVRPCIRDDERRERARDRGHRVDTNERVPARLQDRDEVLHHVDGVAEPARRAVVARVAVVGVVHEDDAATDLLDLVRVEIAARLRRELRVVLPARPVRRGGRRARRADVPADVTDVLVHRRPVQHVVVARVERTVRSAEHEARARHERRDERVGRRELGHELRVAGGVEREHRLVGEVGVVLRVVADDVPVGHELRHRVRVRGDVLPVDEEARVDALRCEVRGELLGAARRSVVERERDLLRAERAARIRSGGQGLRTAAGPLGPGLEPVALRCRPRRPPAWREARRSTLE